jgi:hypothetical protein
MSSRTGDGAMTGVARRACGAAAKQRRAGAGATTVKQEQAGAGDRSNVRDTGHGA